MQNISTRYCAPVLQRDEEQLRNMVVTSNLLNSMNITSGITTWSWIVWVFASGGATVWCRQREALSFSDGLPGLLMGCQDLGQHAAGAALSQEREWGAPVTSGHALLVACCASTTLRTHAGTRQAFNCPLNGQRLDWLHGAAAEEPLCKHTLVSSNHFKSDRSLLRQKVESLYEGQLSLL